MQAKINLFQNRKRNTKNIKYILVIKMSEENNINKSNTRVLISHFLFNIFIEEAMAMFIEETEGIKIN